jgi:hypothetical protein
MTTKTSRRAILAGAAAIPALAIPGDLAGYGEDKIYALIERHRSAHADYSETVNGHSRLETELPREKTRTHFTISERKIISTDDPRWVTGERDVMNIWDDLHNIAMEMLHEGKPRTVAGVGALMRYYFSTLEAGDEWLWPERLEDDDVPRSKVEIENFRWIDFAQKSFAPILERAITA